MAGLRPVRGAPAPLFDRFPDRAAVAEAEGPFLDWHASRRDGLDLEVSPLEQSIGRELARLLNTRCGASLATLATRERSVIDYGLPDYASLYTDNLDDRRRLSTLVRDTIAAFEPRLAQVEVEVELLGHSRHALRVVVRGQVRVEGRLEQVVFRIGAHADQVLARRA